MSTRRINYPIGLSIPLGQTVSNVLTAEDLAGVDGVTIVAPSVLTGTITVQQKHSGLIFTPYQSPLGTSLQPVAGVAFTVTKIPAGGVRLESGATELYHRNFALWAEDSLSAGAQASSAVEQLEGRPLIADLPVDQMGGLWIPRNDGLGVQTSLVDQFGQNNGTLDGADVEISNGIIKFSGVTSRVDLGGDSDGSFADITTGGLTLITVVRINTIGGGNEVILSKTASSGAAGTPYSLQQRTSGSTFEFVWADTVPVQQVLQGATNAAIEGKLQSVIAVHANGDQRIHIDGVLSNSATVALDINSTDTAKLRIGALNTSPAAGIDDGEVHLAAIINRAVSTLEATAIHTELKRMFSELT